MKPYIHKIIALLLAMLLVITSLPLDAANASAIDSVEKNYIIRFKDTTTQEKALNKLQFKKARSIKKFKHSSTAVTKLTQADVQSLVAEGNVWIEEDQPIQLAADTYSTAQEITQVPATHHLGYSGVGVKIAVLDTGVDSSSGELHVAGGTSFVEAEPSLEDMNGHGTRVAGTLGAIQNNMGLIGNAPGSEIYAVKVLDQSGAGSYSRVIEGIEWAIDNKMDIISMSFTGNVESAALKEVLQAAYDQGILLVAAAGNEGRATVGYPANDPSVIAVGAVDANNQLASFSNYGPKLELTAPGTDVQTLGLHGGYEKVSGTSMSAPQVAGIAAMVKEANQSLTNVEIRNILRSSGYRSATEAHTLVNGLAAVQVAVSGLNPSTPQPEPVSGVDEIGKVAIQHNVEESLVQQYLDQGYALQEVDNALGLQEQGIEFEQALQKSKQQVVNNSRTELQTVLNQDDLPILFSTVVEDEPEDDDIAVMRTAGSSDTAISPETLVNINTNVDQAPYAVTGLGEDISTLDGSLSMQSADLTLPGRNGFSFGLKRVYQQSNSQFYDISREYHVDGYKYQVIFDGYIQPFRKLYTPLFVMNNYKWYNSVYNERISQNYWKLDWRTNNFPTATSLVNRMNEENPGSSKAGHYYEFVSGSAFLRSSAEESMGSKQAGRFPTNEFSTYADAEAELNIINGMPSDSLYGLTPDKLNENGDVTFNKVFVASNRNATIRSIPVNGYMVQTTSPTYEEKNYPIGKGWSWDLPYVKTDSGSTYVHLTGGGTYEVSGTTLKGYPWKDLSFSSTSGTINVGGTSISYVYSLNHVQGTKVYFNAEGKVLQMVDAHGNYINFFYSYVNAYGRNLLTSLKDPLNNSITISYTNAAVTLTAGDRTVTYNKVACGSGCEGKELLESVVDPMQRTTRYQYDIKKDTRYNLLGNTVEGGVPNGYALLRIVTHPTGAETHYQYEALPVTRYVGPYAVNQAYRISSREDHIVFQDTTYNPPRVSYTPYNRMDVTYSDDYAKTYEQNATFSTTVRSGISSTQYTYDKVYTNSTTPITYYKTQQAEFKDTNNTLRDSRVNTYEYNRTQRWTVPSKVTNQVKKESLSNGTASLISSSTPVVASWQYDDFGNVTSSVDPYLVETKNVYDATTGYLRSSTTPIGLDTSNQTVKRFSEVVRRNAKGDVEESKVWQQTWAQGASAPNPNPKLLSWTEATYNSAGNMTSMTVKREDGTTISKTQLSQCDPDTYIGITGCPQTAEDYTNSLYRVASVDVKVYDPATKTYLTKTIKQTGKYNRTTGLISQYVDGNGYTTTYALDKLGRLNQMVYQGDNGKTHTLQYSYDDLRNEVQATNEDGIRTYTAYNPLGWKIESGLLAGSGKKAKAKTIYDQFGRTISSEDASGNLTTYEYNATIDPYGRLTQTNYPDEKDKEESQRTSSKFTYDDINRNKLDTDRAGNQVKTSYDLLGRAVKQEDSGHNKLVSSQVYNYAGNVIESRDGKNNATVYQYDALGQLLSVKNAKNETTRYEYDLAGRLLKTISPDNSYIEKQYDALGRMIWRKDQAGQTDLYSYDNNGNMVFHQDRNSKKFWYAYTARNWLKTKTSPTETISYTYTDAGARLTMSDLTGLTQWAYEPETGLLQKVTYPQGETQEYTYNPNGSVATLQDPFGKVLEYGHDSMERISNVRTFNNDANAYASFQYDKGQLLTYTLKDRIDGSTGRLTTTMTYGFYGLESLKHSNQAGTTYNTYSYHYDGASNIDSREEKTGQDMSTPATRNHTFVYDELNRIDSTFNLGATVPLDQYTYDNKGNRLTQITNVSLNLTDKSYTYDDWNRLTDVQADGKTVHYTYNGDGLLVERKENGVSTRYYYDGSFIIAEGTVNPAGKAAFKTRYIRADGKLLAREDAAGKAFYLLNGHGDVVELRDKTGRLLNQYSYDIWGNVQKIKEEVANPFLYSGEYWDSSTNLQYLRARWYDPNMGRFINEDTYEGDIKNPLSLNLYTYVENNPLRYVDPTGHGVYSVGTATQPYLEFDEDFVYDSDVKAKFSDYKSWFYWGIKLEGAKALRDDLRDGIAAYEHYREGDGKDFYINYDTAYIEDSIIKDAIDNEIISAQYEAERLYKEYGYSYFNITGSAEGVQNGATENWQKAIGAHHIWGNGNVIVDSQGNFRMEITINAIDRYNFNKGMADIASGTPDDVNGRFAVLGWAKSFMTYGKLTRIVTWSSGDISNTTSVSQNGRN